MTTNDFIPETFAIQLTKNQVTTVDIVDSDLSQFNWQAQPCNTYASGLEYLARRQYMKQSKKFMVYMHRVILSRILERELLPNEIADHINGNPLDNRRSNIRLATRSQNNMNKRKGSRNVSGFKGVSLHKETQKWVAKIGKNGTYKHLGLFNTPEEAFEAYCNAGAEHHGEFFNPG